MNTRASGSVAFHSADGEDSVQQAKQYPDEIFAHLTLHNEIFNPIGGIIALGPQPLPKPLQISHSQYVHWQHAIELTARLVLAAKNT